VVTPEGPPSMAQPGRTALGAGAVAAVDQQLGVGRHGGVPLAPRAGTRRKEGHQSGGAQRLRPLGCGTRRANGCDRIRGPRSGGVVGCGSRPSILDSSILSRSIELDHPSGGGAYIIGEVVAIPAPWGVERCRCLGGWGSVAAAWPGAGATCIGKGGSFGYTVHVDQSGRRWGGKSEQSAPGSGRHGRRIRRGRRCSRRRPGRHRTRTSAGPAAWPSSCATGRALL